MKEKKLAKLAVLLMLGVFVMGLAIPAMAADTTPNSVTGYGRMMGQRLQTMVNVVSDLTGLGVDEVRAERQDGKSLATIASENGVDAATVTSKVIETNQTRLKADLDAGKITQEQYDTCVSQMDERVKERLERTKTGGNGQGGRGQGQGRGMGNGQGSGMNGQGRGCGGNGTCINNTVTQ